MAALKLAGRCVLLVEDEYLIAEEMHARFLEAGAEVLGPVGRLDQALALATGAARIDAAVLDVRLHDELVYPVADALRARGAPFVFATGYEKAAIPARFANIPHLEKPVEPASLVKALLG
jgi:CheY-like chemotaxis protein